jgi:transcriptional regulator with XRE-family HTH domain
MEIEGFDTLNDLNLIDQIAGSTLNPIHETSGALKAKTSLRLRYEAEAQVILKKLGGLNGIRFELGLSQRKICQLLLVDPSSWSRWIHDESKTPPHILRSLEWYMALMDKYPGFDINFWIHSSAKSTSLAFEKTQTLEAELLTQTVELKKRIQFLETQIEMLARSQAITPVENLQSHGVPRNSFFGLKEHQLRIIYILLAFGLLIALKRIGLF